MAVRRKRSYPVSTPLTTLRHEEYSQLDVVTEAGNSIDAGERFDRLMGNVRRTAEIAETQRVNLPEEMQRGEHRGVLAKIGVIWSVVRGNLWLWEIAGSQPPLSVSIPQVTTVHLAFKPPWLYPSTVSFVILISTSTVTHVYGYLPPLTLLPSHLSFSSLSNPLFYSLPCGRLFTNSRDGGISEVTNTRTSWFSSTRRLRPVESVGRSWTRVISCGLGISSTAVVREMVGDTTRNLLYVLVETGKNDYRLDVYTIAETAKLQLTIEWKPLMKEIAVDISLQPLRIFTFPVSPELLLLTATGHLLSFTFKLPEYQVAMKETSPFSYWLRNGTVVCQDFGPGDIVETELEYILARDMAELLGVLPRNRYNSFSTPSPLIRQASTVNYLYLPQAGFYHVTPTSLYLYQEKRPFDQLQSQIQSLDSLIALYGEKQVSTWQLAVSLVSPVAMKPTISIDENAVFLHFSRILRPIWREKVIENDFFPTFQTPHLNIISEKVNQLVGFLERNCQDRLLPFQANAKGARTDYFLDSLYQIHKLALRTREVILLFSLLEKKYGLRKAIQELSSDLQVLLGTVRFRELLVTEIGQVVCEKLVEMYVKITKMEDISMYFPSIFPRNRQIVAEAKELIEKGQVDLAVKRLVLCADSDAIPSLLDTISRVADAKQSYLTLCFARLQELQGQKASLSPCISQLIRMLQWLEPCEGDILHAAMSLAESIDSEELHFALFRLFIKTNQSEKLVKVNSPHLISFITTEPFPASIKAHILLNRGHYREACEAFLTLANSDNSEEMLLSALLCIDSSLKTHAGETEQLRQKRQRVAERLARVRGVQSNYSSL